MKTVIGSQTTRTFAIGRPCHRCPSTPEDSCPLAYQLNERPLTDSAELHGNGWDWPLAELWELAVCGPSAYGNFPPKIAVKRDSTLLICRAEQWANAFCR